ncbi:putative F-box/FBD/LRR-repeat protein [Tripterygium wilfordii]|uniref:Putative F-box/FBD/LRR-repeat protein n=1 Tax=Tripterygium wilfordii TaxID=458696 RepID=A0A7J7DS80_TRIWF|nr:putative F-box/FBD/LRR-repeat protein [Tripterygium wilfordii]
MILTGINTTKKLLIGHQCLQALFEQGYRRTEFSNLRDLVVYVKSLSDDLVHALAFFLQGLPRGLKTLSIIGRQATATLMEELPLAPFRAYRFKAGFWEAQNLLCIQNLEKVKLEVFDQNGLELLEYLLDNYTLLKELDIIFTSPLPTPIQRKIDVLETCPTLTLNLHDRL